MVSDIEYEYSLALSHGDYYLGQAVVRFYLEQMPANDDDLFLNFQALAVSNLTINEHSITGAQGF